MEKVVIVAVDDLNDSTSVSIYVDASQNIFRQGAGAYVTLGVPAHFQGGMPVKAAINFASLASANSGLPVRAAVNNDHSTVAHSAP